MQASSSGYVIEKVAEDKPAAQVAWQLAGCTSFGRLLQQPTVRGLNNYKLSSPSLLTKYISKREVGNLLLTLKSTLYHS